MSKFTCMDLFAGCGGLTIGLGQAGIDVRWANEIDTHAAETYRRSHLECTLFEEDVKVLYRRLLDRDPHLPRPGEVDLIAGGGYYLMGRILERPNYRRTDHSAVARNKYFQS